MTAPLLAPRSTAASLVAAGRRPAVSARFVAARQLGLAASALSRATRHGAGTTIGGRVLLAVDPAGLQTAALGRRVAVVTGTNGKTTTRTLLVAALATRGRVVSNRGGANLPAGLAMALARDLTAPQAVLEVDEYVVGPVVAAIRADVVVLLNLSRDQLDRVGEVSSVAARWRAAWNVDAEPRTFIANADDPQVVWAVRHASDVVWVATGPRWLADAASCPACGEPLIVGSATWRSRCGLRRPEPSWRLDGSCLVAPDGSGHQLSLRLPGRVNAVNAVFAAAAAARLGIPPRRSLSAMSNVTAVEGRYATSDFRGRWIRILLAKNPAGWRETLEIVRPAPAPIVVAVNARVADGRDPAWLWDVPFERWAGRHVIVTGERALDVGVRLKYADVPYERVPRLRDALLAGDVGRTADVVANYTAFRQIGRLLDHA